MDLFKQSRPRKSRMAYRVENLDPEKNISSTIRVSEDKREYTVCLCLANRTIRNTFPSYLSALKQMERYREKYKYNK